MRAAARILADCGLGPVHRTCLSLRDGSTVWITRDEAGLESLGWSDVLQSGLYRRQGPDESGAPDLTLHRAVYLGTHHCVVLQTTPPAALALSVGATDAVGLLDGVSVPLLPFVDPAAPLGERLAKLLRREPVVLVAGVAAVAAGQDLEAAARLLCELEGRARAMLAPQPMTCG